MSKAKQSKARTHDYAARDAFSFSVFRDLTCRLGLFIFQAAYPAFLPSPLIQISFFFFLCVLAEIKCRAWAAVERPDVRPCPSIVQCAVPRAATSAETCRDSHSVMCKAPSPGSYGLEGTPWWGTARHRRRFPSAPAARGSLASALRPRQPCATPSSGKGPLQFDFFFCASNDARPSCACRFFRFSSAV